MTESKFLDSSVWLSYYFGDSKEAKDVIDGDVIVLTSALCIFEVKKRLLKLKKNAKEFTEFIKKRSAVYIPSMLIIEKAADVSVEYDLGAMDAIIYTSALLNNTEFVTGDNDFRGLKNVRVIE